MRHLAIILVLSLAACSAADERADETPLAVPATPTAQASASPATQPEPAAQQIDCGDEANGGFDNVKSCYYANCEKGDPEACRMAESFNGNLDQSEYSESR